MLFFDEIIKNRRVSSFSGKPLMVCQTCAREMTPGEVFLIAKAFSSKKCVMETVQCLECQTDVQQGLSERSKENLRLYGGRRLREFFEDPLARQFYYLEEPSCVITTERIADTDTFELYTVNPSFSEAEDYFFVGPTAVEQMADLLSEQTRKNWERFLESIQPKNPEIVLSPFWVG